MLSRRLLRELVAILLFKAAFLTLLWFVAFHRPEPVDTGPATVQRNVLGISATERD